MLASRFKRLASLGGPRSLNNAQCKIGSRSRAAPTMYHVCKRSGVRLHSSHRLAEFTKKVAEGPSLGEFINGNEAKVEEADLTPSQVPYLDWDPNIGRGKSVFVESYGCQMNLSDTEIVYAIMEQSGYQKAQAAEEADVVFLNTCAIRDHAEQKIWTRLTQFRSLKKERGMQVGVLGCMAERLKEQLLEKEKLVDLVAGPDAYRDLPRLLGKVEGGEKAMNVLLSADETYADVTPVRYDSNGVSAYVSIMRGCNNMCTYCIVPFTRGRERSRPIASIEEEIRMLSEKGYKEVVLLGQNVNSYNDMSEVEDASAQPEVNWAPGFETVYRKPKKGVTFTELMDRISLIDPEMRIRFTSPHPKDFPEDLLTLISQRPNISKALHIPAQSGNSDVLKRMRRGYTREAYIRLIDRINQILPGTAVTSDFISGFCGETEEEHKETLSLLEYVKYDQAFMFAYSMREKTPAHRKMQDDIPLDVKKRRLNEVIQTFHAQLREKNKSEIGRRHLVLVEGNSRKSDTQLVGRSDTNKKVVFDPKPLPSLSSIVSKSGEASKEDVKVRDYVIVHVDTANGQTLVGRAIAKTTLQEYAKNKEFVDTMSM